MSHVGRKESMRWATSEQNYDGGDWEENELGEIAEEDETMSIKSEDLEVKHDDDHGHDYRDIYNYYDNDDDDDSKRQSLNQQLEEDIYQHLEPGHSRSTSKDSQVDPELAVLYEGTDAFLNRPISIYSDTMQTKPLTLHGSDSDRHIQKILTPATAENTEKSCLFDSVPEEDTSDLATPVASMSLGGTGLQKELKEIEQELSEPKTSPPAAPSSGVNKPLPEMPTTSLDQAEGNTSSKSEEPPLTENSISRPSTPPASIPDTSDGHETPFRSPSMESVVFSPVELPTRMGYDMSPGSSTSGGSRKSFVASPDKPAGAVLNMAPALALTAATPEGSDTEQDARERPDWQPRWSPQVPRPEPEKYGTDLHESQISLDISPEISGSKPEVVKGFVDSAVEGQGDSSESEAETESKDIPRASLDMPPINSTTSKDESIRSTIGSLENDKEISELPSQPLEEDKKDPEPKGIAQKITRPPHVDIQAVLSLNTTEKRQQGLWDLRVKETEYTTQLSMWLEATLRDMDDRSLLFTDGKPPESEGHSLPASRQVGTAITHSGVKTKETFQKVGKGFNAMKKLMRS